MTEVTLINDSVFFETERRFSGCYIQSTADGCRFLRGPLSSLQTLQIPKQITDKDFELMLA